MSYCSRSRRRRFTVLDFKSWAYSRINFGDLATFSVDFFCISYSECPPYFYFRFIWLTDLESIPHASTPTSIIPTKFEVDIHCRVTSFLSADTSRDLVTLTWTLKVEHIAAFTAIFSNICTAHAQKRLFMNFRCKFRHRLLTLSSCHTWRKIASFLGVGTPPAKKMPGINTVCLFVSGVACGVRQVAVVDGRQPRLYVRACVRACWGTWRTSRAGRARPSTSSTCGRPATVVTTSTAQRRPSPNWPTRCERWAAWTPPPSSTNTSNSPGSRTTNGRRS